MQNLSAEYSPARPLAPEQIEPLVTLINLVRTGEATTRPTLGQVSALGRTIVTQRVDQAIEMGYLAEGELGRSTGGRQPRHLRFSGQLGRFVAIEFGTLHVGVAIMDLAQSVVREGHAEWDLTRGPDESMAFVSELLDGMLEEGVPIWGIAVGIPGPVDFGSGRPIAPPIMPGWHLFNIRAWMEDRYGAPVFVDNEANLKALGELYALGAWDQHNFAETDNILYVKVGTGIGAGLISEGHVHRGANGAAGDVGHIAVADRNEVVCRCGQRGCLEAIAGGWALARDGEVAASSGESQFLARIVERRGYVQPADIAEGALNGDPTCIDLVSRSGRVVGEMLASLVNFFNPSAVAIGGSIASTGDLFLAAVRRVVYRRSLPLALRDLRIIPAVAEHEIGRIGAGRLVAERIFQHEAMVTWLPQGSPRANLEAVYSARLRRNPA
ncbi:ROK family protein [Microbacterium trichothecenolyticum]|uniref:ROK family protein n=1 Tax=Microbacterium trichothecenolyticum TaxID=69370 RepID=UPI0035BE34CF